MEKLIGNLSSFHLDGVLSLSPGLATCFLFVEVLFFPNVGS